MCMLRSGRGTGTDAPGRLFTSFHKLRPDIRERIWILAIDARVFHFIGGKKGVEGPTTGLLSACKESRLATLGEYSIESFTMPAGRSLWSRSTVPTEHDRCFNFAKDIFVLDSNSPRADVSFLIDSEPFECIQHLVITPEFWKEVVENKDFYDLAFKLYCAVQKSCQKHLKVSFATDEKIFTKESSMEVIQKLKHDLIEYGCASKSAIAQFEQDL